jgi:hypothetical protein
MCVHVHPLSIHTVSGARAGGAACAELVDRSITDERASRTAEMTVLRVARDNMGICYLPLDRM